MILCHCMRCDFLLFVVAFSVAVKIEKVVSYVGVVVYGVAVATLVVTVMVVVNSSVVVNEVIVFCYF